jgi:CheY-like chemotaxis protein
MGTAQVTAARMYVRNLNARDCRSPINLPTSLSGLAKHAAAAHHRASLAMRGFMARLRKTILCIDDQWNGLMGRKIFLEKNGYQVLEATGGDEGLRLFLTHPVDAVVLDYQMPGMNGDVVAARMKRLKSHIPILLLSAYGPLPEKKLQSVDTFLTKSQELKVLLPALQDLLTSRPKPFFHRWFDTWRGRAHAVRH